MNSIIQFLDACGHFYLATSDGLQAKVRPMNFARNIQGRLSLYTSQKKDLYLQLRQNPCAEIAATGQDGWIRIHGEILFLNSAELFDHWADEAEFFRFEPADRVVCSFVAPVIEYMPGYQKPLPDFVSGWERTLLPEGEIRYSGAL
jgi:hypothetical protein